MRMNSTVKQVAICLALVVFASALVAAQEQSEAAAITQTAQKLLQENKFEEALQEVAKAIAADENYGPVYYVAGFAYGNLQRVDEAREAFIKAAELTPGWGEAHRMAAMSSFQSGRLELAWEHAIKAHQSGVDMSEAFANLEQAQTGPDDLQLRLAADRVWIAPLDTTNFEQAGTSEALTGGANRSGATRTGIADRVLGEAVLDIQNLQQATRRAIADSRFFGLVQRQEMARYLYQYEVDSIADDSRRRLRGVMKLVDAQTGEEAYRRRVDFSNIASLADINRDLTNYIEQLEAWAADKAR